MPFSFSPRSLVLARTLASGFMLAGAITGVLLWMDKPGVAQPIEPTGERLSFYANQLGVLLGAWDHSVHFSVDNDSQAISRREYNIFGTGDIHPGGVQQKRGVFDYTSMDTALNIVHGWQPNRKTIACHLTGRNLYMPDWWVKAPASEQGKLLDTHIDNVMTHYKGKVDIYVAVNEVLDSLGGYQKRWRDDSQVCLNSIGWEPMGLGLTNDDGSPATMPKFVGLSFARAKAVNPSATLLYNDAENAAFGERETQKCYDLVRALKAKGYPIDGVGFQAHLSVEKGTGDIYNAKGELFDVTGFEQNMQRYADLGLDIYLTELDVRVPENPTSEDLERQASAYRRVVEACLRQPHCKGIIMWGTDDVGAWERQLHPTLFSDQDGRAAKPAYYAIQSLLEERTTDFNKVGNPGFEAEPTSTGEPAGWMRYSPNGTQAAGHVTTEGQPRAGIKHLELKSEQAHTVYLYQVKTGLPNGMYTLRVWAKRPDAQGECSLSAENYGGAKVVQEVPVSSGYSLVQLRDIPVTNGQCQFGVWSQRAGQVAADFDDFELVKQ